MVGDLLAHYRILEKLGAGGMGVVYRAEDTRLGREVALKVLPDELASDRSRLARFEREARAVAALNHPNIVTIHSVEESDGRPFLTMELVEGRPLADLMQRGALAVPRYLEIAVPLARALAAAHAKGIVHRDLKPANVVLTTDGTPKLLDFGIAKLRSAESLGALEATLATDSLTREGGLLGTVAYMSPEQASGQAVDHRSDQFAFGALSYQMLTGRQPFAGATAPETLAAILRGEPEPLERAAPAVPAPLRWTIERCLAKAPEGRYESTGDLAREIETLAGKLPELATGAPTPPAPRRRLLLPGLAAVAAGFALAWGLHSLLTHPAPPAAPPSLSFERVTFRRGRVSEARFDPASDGVLYSAAWEGEPSRLFLKRPDTVDPLAFGPADSRLLAVSAHGELLLLHGLSTEGPFLDAGSLSRMPITGSPRVLDESISEATWDDEGALVALVRERADDAILEFPVGAPRHQSKGMLWHLRKHPRENRIAYLELPGRGGLVGTLVVADAEGSEVRLSTTVAQGLDWSPDGSEIWFARTDRLMAVDMEGNERELARFPQRLRLMDVADDGRVLLAVESQRFEMMGKPRDSSAARELTWLSWSAPLDLSPDGGTILFNECSTWTCFICLRGFAPEPPVVIGPGFGFALSPDGTSVLGLPSGRAQLTTLPTGAGTPREWDLTSFGLEKTSIARWGRDGRSVYFAANQPGEGTSIFRLDLDGERPVPLTPQEVDFGLFAVSPSGDRVAVRHIDGGLVVYQRDRPEPLRLLEENASPIQWSADSRSLLFYRLDRVPTAIERIDLDTLQRRTVGELTLSDPAGVHLISPVAITPQGDAWVYGFQRVLSELYVVRGLDGAGLRRSAR